MASSSSTTGTSKSPAKTPSVYLDHLLRTHVALTQIVKEVPSSRCGSPMKNVESEARVDALRARVQEVFELANGDPADGKWGLLAQLLRTGTALGRYRWIGTNAEKKRSNSGSGWINAKTEAEWFNAKTEAEWFEWQRQRAEEDRLKLKVESWKKHVDVAAHPLEVGAIEPLQVSTSGLSENIKVGAVSRQREKDTTVTGSGATTKTRKNETTSGQVSRNNTGSGKLKAKATIRTNDLKDPSPLGFNVIKRSSIANAGKPKVPSNPKPSNDPVAGPSNSKDDSMDVSVADKLSIISQAPHIANISESSFLPPSFPSQLVTSTPKQDLRHKPAPIPPIPFASSLPSPESVRAHRRPQAATVISSSLPALPTPPGIPAFAESAKRRRSPSLSRDRVVKKARTMPSADQMPSSGPMPPPITPAPSLQEPLPSLPPATPHPTVQLPTLTQLLASTKPSSKQSKTPSSSRAQKQSNEKAPNPFKPPSHSSRTPPSPDLVAPPMLEQYPLDPYAMDLDMISPAKSLSSLAGSDSEYSDHEETPLQKGVAFSQGEGGFNPMFASTQVHFGSPKEGGGEVDRGVTRTGSGFGWMGYNSQFDVDGQIDRVSKFMEKDVDYDGWLKDLSAEVGEGESADVPESQ